MIENLFSEGLIKIENCFYNSNEFYKFAKKYFKKFSFCSHSLVDNNKKILKVSPYIQENYSGSVPYGWHHDHSFLPHHCITINQNVNNAQGTKTYFIDTRKPLKNMDLKYLKNVSIDVGVANDGLWQKNFIPNSINCQTRNINVVQTHPVSNDLCLFSGSSNIYKIYNDDDNLYLDYLNNLDPYSDFIDYREVLEWKEGDLIMYDNMIMVHKRDTIPPKQNRQLWKMTALLDLI